MNEKPVCFDCGAPYGVDGWYDVVIPNEVWNEIAADCGLLCFRCMTKRLLATGKSGVPVAIVSGPYVDANETWRQIGWDHGYAVCREEFEGLRTPIKPSAECNPHDLCAGCRCEYAHSPE